MSATYQRQSRQRPTQAVILAGGRGTRLRPLTDTRPKPMIEIHGKPFLEYLVEMLRDQGFDRILLLLGYLPEVVQNHFGDGRRWGVTIEYSITAVDDDTGRRVKLAAPRIDECFFAHVLRQLLADGHRQNVETIHSGRCAGHGHCLPEQGWVHDQ